MIGAIIGDIIGSVHEFKNDKNRDVELFTKESTFTDDTVLSVATASAILESADYGERYGRYFSVYHTREHSGYTGLGIGYGPMFTEWGLTPHLHRKPYRSYGNGSAMRVGPIGWAYDRLSDVLIEAQLSASCTHDHIEGIKGAQSVASAILMSRQGFPVKEIKSFIESYFGYFLDFDIDDLNKNYGFNATSPGSVPQAIFCALTASSFEDAIRRVLYIGGDTDTIGAIAGSIAEPLFGIPEDFRNKAMQILQSQAPGLKGTLEEFEKRFGSGMITKPVLKENQFEIMRYFSNLLKGKRK